MVIEVIMPQGGQDIETGKIVRWLKPEGDPVQKGEVICEVETEKAVFEIEAPDAGFLRKILAGDGEEVPIFSVIGFIGELDEEIPDVESTVEKKVSGSASKTISSPEGRPTSRERQGRIPISPRAKRLADEQGIPIEKVQGSGAKGRVTEKDVKAFLESQSMQAGGASEDQVENGQITPVSKIRKLTARKMQQSNQTIPHFYLTLSVDMTKALKFRAEMNKSEETSISLSDLITRACVLAFQEVPELNCSVLDEERMIQWDDLNIGIAVAVDSELVVPVIDKVDQLSLLEIALARHLIVEKAKEGKLASLSPARFTISNLGMWNVDQFHAIINPPEVAILAVSSVEKRPVAIGDDKIGVREMLNLTLSIDHRAVDGVVASRFLNSIKQSLEEPDQLLD